MGRSKVSDSIEGLGRHRQGSSRRLTTSGRRRWLRLASVVGAVLGLAAVLLVYEIPRTGEPVTQRGLFALSTTPGSYVGLYSEGVPGSYEGITAFTAATGVKPDLVPYYSGWWEPFKASFAIAAAKQGAIPLVQIDPSGINIAAIASGRYDAYLATYADAVRAYRHPIVVSFGHEMNGFWYSWGRGQTSPAVFVAAWRHIVRLFRSLRVRNVTWLWTVNAMDKRPRVPSPKPWWPGSSYVTWVGIDGYYLNSSSVFASLFGPTIAAVRALTHAPILIAETAAAPAAGQPAKIANLVAGVRLYGLLGFVWFDSIHVHDWRLESPAAIAAFRRGAKALKGLPS
jgi:mannan endo-1,4-beta-mannosidase